MYAGDDNTLTYYEKRELLLGTYIYLTGIFFSISICFYYLNTYITYCNLY